MDPNFQGDLTDIVRASGGHVLACSGSAASDAPPPPPPSHSWQLPSHLPMDFLPDAHHHTGNIANTSFGDPFLSMSDPLLHELNIVAASGFISSGNNNTNHDSSTDNLVAGTSFEDDLKGQCTVFPRIRIPQGVSNHDLGISQRDSPVLAAATAASPSMISSPRGISMPQGPTMVSLSDMISVGTRSSPNTSDMISVGPTGSPKTCLVDNTGAQLQISSPRNLGLKRRKSQAKKVVCIPAPAAANSRSSGEVVPSDLWAWRKYGQKPIKGSPYPRGYYRCSSSKGCSARKQVERSRTDPNMLVITYTSEHNHPWPTQRNALAGSTRSSHPSKASSSVSKSSQNSNSTPAKEEVRRDQISSNNIIDETTNMSSPGNTGAGCSNSAASIKEEVEEDDQNEGNEKKQDMMDHNGGINTVNDDYNGINNQTYRPALSDLHQSLDFFADLDELGGDPLSLLFTQGFSTASNNNERDKQALDPFSNFFDWPGENNSNSSMTTASFGEPTCRSL